MNIVQFNIKHFISDLPRLLNDAFNTIKNTIATFYDDTKNKISVSNLDVEGTINANSIFVKNLTFTTEQGNIVNYSNIITELDNLKRRLDNITNITKEQIDALDASIN